MARKFGGAWRNRTADKGFADLCLTTWRTRPDGTKMDQKTKNPPAVFLLAVGQYYGSANLRFLED
jgi:hypothetical protein